MRRFFRNQVDSLDAQECIKNFHYYPDDEKNIIPFETPLQDLFDILVSMAINRYGLRNNIEVRLRETDTKKFSYLIETFDNSGCPFPVKRNTGLIHFMSKGLFYESREIYQVDCTDIYYNYICGKCHRDIKFDQHSQIFHTFQFPSSAIVSKLKKYDPSKKRSKRQQPICPSR